MPIRSGTLWGSVQAAPAQAGLHDHGKTGPRSGRTARSAVVLGVCGGCEGLRRQAPFFEGECPEGTLMSLPCRLVLVRRELGRTYSNGLAVS